MTETDKENSALAGKIALALLVLLLIGTAVLNFIYFRYGNEDRFDEIIYQAAQKHRVDPLLIKAIIKRESRFRYRCVGSKGEIGLMQLMPGAIRDWEHANDERYHLKDEVFNPALNIEIGTWYFARAFSQWRKSGNPKAYALAQYNAGRGNLLKWVKKHGSAPDYKKIVQFPSTRKYISVILKYYQQYLAKKGDNNG